MRHGTTGRSNSVLCWLVGAPDNEVGKGSLDGRAEGRPGWFGIWRRKQQFTEEREKGPDFKSYGWLREEEGTVKKPTREWG